MDEEQITRPAGEYAIVELFGHTTLVGRIAEVERFGTKMLAIEPLFDDALLGVVFHGGAAIYRLTPCSVAVAYKRQPRHGYQLPPAILATVPPALLEPPAKVQDVEVFEHEDQDDDMDDPDDRRF